MTRLDHWRDFIIGEILSLARNWTTCKEVLLAKEFTLGEGVYYWRRSLPLAKEFTVGETWSSARLHHWRATLSWTFLLLSVQSDFGWPLFDRESWILLLLDILIHPVVELSNMWLHLLHNRARSQIKLSPLSPCQTLFWPYRLGIHMIVASLIDFFPLSSCCSTVCVQFLAVDWSFLTFSARPALKRFRPKALQ